MKIRALSTVCPFCVNEITERTYENKDYINKIEDNDICTTLEINHTCDCFCKKCHNHYTVDFGKAILKRYKTSIYDEEDDMKVFVDYESEFDTSYRIVEYKGKNMIIADRDDNVRVVIDDEAKEILKNNHKKAETLAYRAWMTTYR